MRTIVPSEAYEQELLVNWLQENAYKHCAFAQSTFTRSWGQKAKNKRLGVVPGWPDLVVVLKRSKLLWIEMKRCKPASSRLSAEQKIWQQTLNLCGTRAIVCYGAAEAIAAVEKEEQA